MKEMLETGKGAENALIPASISIQLIGNAWVNVRMVSMSHQDLLAPPASSPATNAVAQQQLAPIALKTARCPSFINKLA